jgi:hypothetical protein
VRRGILNHLTASFQERMVIAESSQEATIFLRTTPIYEKKTIAATSTTV